MPLATKLTDFECGQIAALHADGRSHRQIAEAIGRSKCVVTYYLANRENHGKVKRLGRPPKVISR